MAEAPRSIAGVNRLPEAEKRALYGSLIPAVVCLHLADTLNNRWMKSINRQFGRGGDLLERLDGSTPFRRPGAERSVRARSWAIQDGILREAFAGVRMYRRVGGAREGNLVLTFPDGAW